MSEDLKADVARIDERSRSVGTDLENLRSQMREIWNKLNPVNTLAENTKTRLDMLETTLQRNFTDIKDLIQAQGEANKGALKSVKDTQKQQSNRRWSIIMAVVGIVCTVTAGFIVYYFTKG